MLYRPKIPIAIERYLLDGAIIALLVAIYAPLLIHWYDGWLNKTISLEHEYFSHGLIGLPFAAYIVWTHRQQWHQLPNTTHPLGFVCLIIGGFFYLSGQSELVNLSFPAVLAGISLWLKGVPGFKLQSFPLLLVFLATPTAVPYLIAPFTLPLQEFIAGTAGFILIQCGIDVSVNQIYLSVGGRLVEVAPYCAGLKMLFTVLYVGMMLLYSRGTWVSRKATTVFLLGAVIISVSGNIIRNTVLTFFHGTGQDSAFKWLHDGWGGDVYSACLLILLVPLLNVIERYSHLEFK
ncbi:MAG: cyanoexosortase B [Symplocastrum torsivum CPER-KK1]|jgi:cyanoexosortase B|uniref:Cyanoexosortase B n=1 Tax=Symplocastrum torsivum CPER-KK1 TaxID=450513 RepID=A0A951PKW4_9CYAN|nr:cyanoexosortase B [Symplocastrum torsivum CPER-KK1]